VDAFVDTYEKAVAKLYPNIASNPGYSSIVNDQHYARLTSLLEDARNKRARVIEVARPAQSCGMTHPRTMVPTVALNVTDEMNVMRDEIFGPILAATKSSRCVQIASLSFIRSLRLRARDGGTSHRKAPRCRANVMANPLLVLIAVPLVMAAPMSHEQGTLELACLVGSIIAGRVD
jgi:hypothetical protein